MPPQGRCRRISLDRVTPTVAVAGSYNAVRIGADGKLEGDMFDGEGFVAVSNARGITVAGASVLVVGSGGVGSAIAASFAAAGVSRIALFDVNTVSMEALAARLRQHYLRLMCKPVAMIRLVLTSF